MGRSGLITTIDKIISKYPPRFSGPEDTEKDTKLAFRALIDEHPEAMSYGSFIRIYTPGRTAEQIADEILDPQDPPESGIPRQGGRGLSSENRLLLDVDTLLHDPAGYTSKVGFDVDTPDLYSLLKVTHQLRTKAESIDRWLDEQGYPDTMKQLIARALCSLYEVNILFRTELYKAYGEKAKTVRKVPESGPYHQDSFRLNIPAKGGKAITKESVDKDALEFRRYLHQGTTRRRAGFRDRKFYDRKRFRYLIYTVVKIQGLLGHEGDEFRGKPLLDSSHEPVALSFSVDEHLDKALWKPRKNYAVIMGTLPPLSGAVDAGSDDTVPE